MLNHDIIFEIMGHLDLKTCLKLPQVCSQFKLMFKQPRFKKHIADLKFISNIPENMEQKYFILYDGPKKTYNIKVDIKDILWTCNNDNLCPHCCNGEDTYIIVTMKDGAFGFITFWSGCLTYSSEETGGTLEIAPNFDYLYHMCMTNKTRMLYDQTSS